MPLIPRVYACFLAVFGLLGLVSGIYLATILLLQPQTSFNSVIMLSLFFALMLAVGFMLYRNYSHLRIKYDAHVSPKPKKTVYRAE